MRQHSTGFVRRQKQLSYVETLVLQRFDGQGSVASGSPLAPKTPAHGNVAQSTFSQGRPAAMHVSRYEPHKQPSQASGKAIISAALAKAGSSGNHSGKVSYLFQVNTAFLDVRQS